ncbi:MAG: hypothetical protein A3I12_06920 [Gammaproteobacteria bacterium RIFCSPLOWO2_02_FULL_38_11]|nr:MAG: hypothetical protein A2W47_02430 [Gammaproteobacteria bacterium RIFCSPHIGHO2_12_38_15]OGT67893.1 MAG: hypothetical protein A3I12_06920 [Gammaproteobacteria bacterium RIFCSPLOWO2_02_FULL_38_11]
MAITISLDESLITEAKIQSKVLHRSVPKQIEHWARIGHIAEDNPDLTYTQIKDILLGLQDKQEGNIKKYKRGML